MATLILKVTEKCNSNCYYCDVVRNKKNANSLPLELLKVIFIRINEYLCSNNNETINLIWHGGEPLIVGADYYKEVIGIINETCFYTKNRIKHEFQTNLTLLDEDFVNIFRELGLHGVGSSYEPISHIRGPGKNFDSDDYNRKFIKGLNLLEKNNLSWGLIYVVNKKSLNKAKDIFYFLTNLCLSGGILFNPVLIYDKDRLEIAITPEEYVEFLGELLPVWLENLSRFNAIQPFNSYYESIVNNNISLGCVDSGTCAYSYLNISPEGNVSHCGRASDWGLMNYGHIDDNTIDDILKNELRIEFNERQSYLQENDCKGCRFWNLCHGGCPLDSYSKNNSYMFKSEWCFAKKGFIENYFEPILGVKYFPDF